MAFLPRLSVNLSVLSHRSIKHTQTMGTGVVRGQWCARYISLHHHRHHHQYQHHHQHHQHGRYLSQLQAGEAPQVCWFKLTFTFTFTFTFTLCTVCACMCPMGDISLPQRMHISTQTYFIHTHIKHTLLEVFGFRFDYFRIGRWPITNGQMCPRQRTAFEYGVDMLYMDM